MPNWASVLHEIQDSLEKTKSKYLKDFQSFTDRNVIVYYSAWLDKRLVGFLRLGSDLTENYYQIEIPDNLSSASILFSMVGFASEERSVASLEQGQEKLLSLKMLTISTEIQKNF